MREGHPLNCERGSPQWLVEKLDQSSRNAFEFILLYLPKGQPFHLLMISIYLACGMFYHSLLVPSLSGIQLDHYLSIARTFFWLSMTIGFSAGLLHLFGWCRSGWGQWCLTVVTVFSIASSHSWKQGFASAIYVLILFICAFLLLGGCQWLAKKCGQRLQFWHFAWSFVFFLAAVWIVDRILWTWFPNLRSPAPVELLIYPLSVFLLESTQYKNAVPLFSWERLRQLLTPSHFLRPVPIEHWRFQITSDPEKLRRIRLQGLIDLLAMCLFFFAYYLLDRALDHQLQDLSPWLRPFLMGFLFYLQLALKSMWHMRVVTAICRSIGFEMRDGFHYALLAASPVERWTRWAVYHSGWLRGYVFFPLFARTRQLFLSLLCTFATSFWLHSFVHLLKIGGKELTPWHLFRLRSNALYYSLQMLLVYFCAKFPKLWPSGRQRKGWLGVATTLTLMSVIHLCLLLVR